MKYILIILILIAGTLNAGTWRINAKAAAVPADDDVILLEDNNDSWNSKKVTMTNLSAYMASEGADDAVTLTNKSIDSDNNTITNIVNADIKATAAIAWSKMANLDNTGRVLISDASSDVDDSDVTSTELLLLDAGATEAVFDGGAYVQARAVGANQVKVTDGTIEPNTDDDIDLGTSAAQFKDAYLDGELYTDGIDCDGTTRLDGTVLINDGSGDYDFIIETNGRTDALDIDGGTDMVNIGCGLGFNQANTPTFENVDETPSVNAYTFWRSGAAVEEITDFDDGEDGQLLIIYSQAEITFSADENNILPPDDTDLVTGRGDMTMWLDVSGVWVCISYSDNH